jgi:nucleotidyltransferase substrate binding protein (TIGR01987 family)
MIDTSSLARALETLEIGLEAFARAPEDKFIRDACIQRFEYTYELAHKMLRRYLEATEPADVKALSFPGLIRLGFERGLLSASWDVWSDFRTARNITSHAYDEAKANDVVLVLPRFAEQARFLLATIAARPAE